MYSELEINFKVVLMKTKRLYQWAKVVVIVMCLPMCNASCTNNNDNPTIPTNGRAIVSVNTATLYDKLGITDFMIERLAQGGIAVTDSVLVYDQQGLLVARLGSESTSLQNVNISLSDLPYGTYTIVVWQTASSGEDPFWLLKDADQIATVHIVQLYPSPINCNQAIGLYTTSVTIGSGTGTVNAEMEPMGSVVDIRIDSFTPDCDYEYARVVVGGEDPAVDGFYLNPAHSVEDRWLFSDNRMESDRPIGEVFLSSPNNKVFTLSHGENKTFELYGINKTTNELEKLIDAMFTLEPVTVATFYFDLSKAGYQPPYFGWTADFAAWKAQRDAGVLVTDPCLQWGANLQTVHNHVASHHLWWKTLNEELAPEEGHGWVRWYNIARDFYEVYNFETESGNNLTCAICVCIDSTVPVSLANASLVLQGYEYAGQIIYPDQPDVIYDIFFSADGSVEVQVNTYDDGGWQIFYQPTDPNDLAKLGIKVL